MSGRAENLHIGLTFYALSNGKFSFQSQKFSATDLGGDLVDALFNILIKEYLISLMLSDRVLLMALEKSTIEKKKSILLFFKMTNQLFQVETGEMNFDFQCFLENCSKSSRFQLSKQTMQR